MGLALILATTVMVLLALGAWLRTGRARYAVLTVAVCMLVAWATGLIH